MYVLPGNAKFPEAYPTRAYGCADGEGSTGGASGHKAWREVRGGGARASRTSFIFSFLKDLLLVVNGGRDLCFVWGGGGRIVATRGWISVDRGSKATLPLTMPRRVFKSSAKDSARRPSGISLRGRTRGSSAAGAVPVTRARGGLAAPTVGRRRTAGVGAACLAWILT